MGSSYIISEVTVFLLYRGEGEFLGVYFNRQWPSFLSGNENQGDVNLVKISNSKTGV